MILRPLELTSKANDDFVPAWKAVEKIQKHKHESCWLITQPSHAALSGEIAANLIGPRVPASDSQIVRAIALHDAGWGIPDAQAITLSRSAQRNRPKSFIELPPAEFLRAWEKSIEVAESVSPAGGYIVSRHFLRLAEHRTANVQDSGADRKKLKRFLDQEGDRQKKLSSKQKRPAEELESMTDLLQFCDLLSLYICSGAQEPAEFPEYFGVKARLTVEQEGYTLEPALVKAGSEFTVAALRYPASKEQSSKELRVVIR